MAASPPIGSKADWCVAVVHGVGSPQPGETLSLVCKGLEAARPGLKFAGSPRIASADGHVRVLEGEVNGARVRIAEAYWGDVSLVRKGVWTLLRALFINLFGLRYICQRALANAPAGMRTLSALPFLLTRWLIMPAHVLALALAVPFLVRLLASPDVSNTASGATGYLTSFDDLFFWLCIAYAVLGLVAALYMAGSRSTRTKPWDMALAFGLFALASSLFSGDALHRHTASVPVLQDWIATHSIPHWVGNCVEAHSNRPGVNPLFVAWKMVRQQQSLTDGVCELIANSTPLTDKAKDKKTHLVQGVGRYLAVNEFVGDTAFFVSTLAVLGFLVLVLPHIVRTKTKEGRGIVLALTATMLFVVLTAIILEPVDLILRLVQYWNAERTEAYWYELLLIPWIAVVFSVAWWVDRSRRSRINKDEEVLKELEKKSPEKALAALAELDTPERYPRVIVSEVFQTAVIASTAVLVLAFLAFPKIPNEIYRVPIEARLIAPGLLFGIFVIVLLSERLRWGLNFAIDVVNHFIEPGRDYPVRRHIAERFSKALDVLLQDGGCRKLVVLAHSQGTVIALEALLENVWEQRLKARVDSLTIITFGSPWSHIYQHYFDDYPQTAGAVIKALNESKAPVRWINVYRVDDVIGTHVKMDLHEFPVLVRGTFGGHNKYWEQDILTAAQVCANLPG
jgi:hypothetical protein